jgi:transposase-like protein
MTQTAFPLTALSEAQRTQALERLEIIHPALEKHVSQAQVARTHQLLPSTVQLWIKRYREKGLAGLANAARSDKGKSRSLPEQAITLVEGLALQTPLRSAASIYRQVSGITKEHGWKPPSYERVRLIIKNLDPALMTLAHQGAAVLAEIRVFHQDRFICRAICQELAEQTVSLKEIKKARAERRKQVKAGLSTREALVEQFLAAHQEETLKPQTQAKEPVETTGRPHLKRYINE